MFSSRRFMKQFIQTLVSRQACISQLGFLAICHEVGKSGWKKFGKLLELLSHVDSKTFLVPNIKNLSNFLMVVLVQRIRKKNFRNAFNTKKYYVLLGCFSNLFECDFWSLFQEGGNFVARNFVVRNFVVLTAFTQRYQLDDSII